MEIGEKYFKKEMRKLGFKLKKGFPEEHQPYQIWGGKRNVVYIDKLTHKVEYIFKN